MGQISVVWHEGTYRNVKWLISDRDFMVRWCSYIVVPLAQLETIHDVAFELDWHGGVTFDEMVDDNTAWKIGCDYGHYGDDEANGFPLQTIQNDLFAVIDELIALHPEIETWQA